MKKADIAMIILIAAASSLIAYFVASSVFGGSGSYSEKVKTIEAIDSEVVEPDTAIFNKDAINPSVEVQINSNATSE